AHVSILGQRGLRRLWVAEIFLHQARAACLEFSALANAEESSAVRIAHPDRGLWRDRCPARKASSVKLFGLAPPGEESLHLPHAIEPNEDETVTFRAFDQIAERRVEGGMTRERNAPHRLLARRLEKRRHHRVGAVEGSHPVAVE